MTTIPEQAIKDAKSAEKAVMDKRILGPLHGIPVVIKANIDTGDEMATTAGSLALAHHYAIDDAYIVKELRKSGAIILGKTNLSEWANFRSTKSTSGWSSIGFQTKNPYDIKKNPCGSSSGSAVAVSANLTSVSIGTETDGSVVCPAGINGIVGIKPTLGLVSRDGIIPIAHSQDTAGPMARTVRDAAILLTAISSLDQSDILMQTSSRTPINYAEYLDKKAIHQEEPQLSSSVLSGLVVESHGFVGATDLTSALRRAAGAHGVTFTPSTSAARVSSRDGTLQVETAVDTVSCDAVVMAAGSWSGQVEAEGEEAIPVRPVRGQLLHLGWPKSPPERVIWTDQCYLVPWTDGSVLIGATVEDVGFDERATVAGVQQLIEMTCGIIPTARKAWFNGVRVGLRPGTPDDLPAIGPSERLPGLFYATGHFRNGVLLAPLTARIVADYLLDGKRDKALEATSLSRFAVG